MLKGIVLVRQSIQEKETWKGDSDACILQDGKVHWEDQLIARPQSLNKQAKAWNTGELQMLGNTLLIKEAAANPIRQALSSYDVPPTLSTEVFPHCIHFKEQCKGIPPIFAMLYKIIQKPKSTERHYEGKDTITKENYFRFFFKLTK